MPPGGQSIDKASGKEVLIRNDGVYVISGIFREQMLAFAEKNTFSSRLLAVEAREAVRRQAIGKSRWQTAGLSTIRARGTPPPRAVSAFEEPITFHAKARAQSRHSR